MKQIQGRNVTLQLFLDGKLVQGIPVKKFDWEGEDEIRKRDLIGEARQSAQLMIDGYKGNFTCDLDNKRHHEIIKYLNEIDKTVDRNYEFALQVVENYRDGSREKYRFVRATLRIPKTTVNSRKDDVEYSIEWFAEDIVYLK